MKSKYNTLHQLNKLENEMSTQCIYEFRIQNHEDDMIGLLQEELERQADIPTTNQNYVKLNSNRNWRKQGKKKR